MTCLLCATAAPTAIVNRIARNDTPQVSVACSRCGFVQVAPMPTAEELREYYRSGAYRADFPPLRSDAEEQAIAEAGARWLVEHLGLKHGDRVHEVGAGFGRVAREMWRAGFDATAWDDDPAMRATWGTGGAQPFTENAHLVYAMQVLEHCPDPIATLREWSGYCRDGGRVHVQVPTLERIYGGPSYFFQKPHVVNFTRRTLTATMLRAGLTDVRTGIMGSVLWATGTVGGEPLSYDEIEAQLGPVDDVPALIAAGTPQPEHAPSVTMAEALAHYDPQPFAALFTWLQEERSEPPPADVRAQMLRLAAELARQRIQLCRIKEAMDAETQRVGDDWHPDAWIWGYRCGQARRLQVDAEAIGAVINNTLVRVGE